jgi:hypothetical protein
MRWTYDLALISFAAAACHCGYWEAFAQNAGKLIEPRGRVLFEEHFKDLDNWHHEGTGRIFIPESGLLRIECISSQQGDMGTQAFCRLDFPDSIAIEYDLKVLTNYGLIITFVAMMGLEGQDMLTALPPRKGMFKEYTGNDAGLRSYHVSISRYDDAGNHTGVSNWRRNPGLHLMSQGPDLCKKIQRWYRIRIVKNGHHCQLGVNGQLAHEFIDPGDIATPLPTDGKVGFRAIGANVQALIRNFRVVALH